mgnify:CR=1 FL=1
MVFGRILEFNNVSGIDIAKSLMIQFSCDREKILRKSNLLSFRPTGLIHVSLTVVISDIITPYQSMVVTYSPVGLKSSPVMIFSNENSKVDVSIMIDDYSVEGAISSCG